MSWQGMCLEIGGRFIALRACLRSIGGSYKSWTCGCGNKAFYFGSRFDACGSQRVFRQPFNPGRLFWDLSPQAGWCGSRVLGREGFKMGPSLAAVGLLFWWKVRGLMPIGSRVKTCAKAQMSGMHYTCFSPSKNTSPDNIALLMWSRWPRGPHVTGGSRNRTPTGNPLRVKMAPFLRLMECRLLSMR